VRIESIDQRGTAVSLRTSPTIATPAAPARAWRRYLLGMPFYVHAQDRPGTGAELLALAEAHWSFMDRFADRLILRGPTLSDDGTEHTGSVHVVDLADRAGAERFATEEPYWRAGLYQDVTTVRTVVLLHRDIDVPSASDAPNALVTGQWPSQPHDTGLRLPAVDPDDRLRFVAVLVDDDRSHTTGIVSVVRAVPSEARSIIQPFADRLAGEPVGLTAQRWSRGGRS
jgi:uncharacterized protein YciI